MAPLFDALIAQLRKLDLLDKVDEIVPMFEGAIDAGATVHLHADDFAEITEYMDQHISMYSIMFEGVEGLWVPVDLIKFIYREDTNFRFRLSRFLKSLTERDYRTEEEDLLMDLEMGNIGNSFISWDMTLVLFLQETVGREAGKKAKKEKAKPMEQIQEAPDQEDSVTDQWEASMALVALQGDTSEEVTDELVEGDEVLEEVPDLTVLSLHPVIIDGKEFLFLDDITKTLGFREDEALSIITMTVGNQGNSTEGTVKISFEDDSLTKALAYNVGSTPMEAVVANALVQIKEDAEFYESVLDSAFVPHTPFFASNAQDQGSIDITKDQLVAIDDATEVWPKPNYSSSFTPNLQTYVNLHACRLLLRWTSLLCVWEERGRSRRVEMHLFGTTFLHSEPT